MPNGKWEIILGPRTVPFELEHKLRFFWDTE